MSVRCFRLFILVLVLTGTGTSYVDAADTSVSSVPDAALLETTLRGRDVLELDGRTLEARTLSAVYEQRQFQPIWTDSRQQSFLEALGSAAFHGLDAAAFSVTADDPVARELLLTDAFIRYAGALARGRVDPQKMERDWRIAAPAFDPAERLTAAIADDFGAALPDLAPHHPAYERLREALQRYRQFAMTGWTSLPAGKSIRPRDHGGIVRQLRERLAIEGYLAVTDRNGSLYDQATSAAVSRFQAAHGLPVDGVAGTATLAALNVPATTRVEEIALNLERWRLLPHVLEPARIEVNAAAAIATLYEEGQPAKTMRVIIGKARLPTPVLRADLESVLFNPPWFVPNSIYAEELGPDLRRDPSFMERGNYVFREVHGQTQLVQLPGPKNALGQIKFDMPNTANVYMHDTPDRRLFARTNRALSHGCIRVEDPRDLARLVLDSPAWTPEEINAAIGVGTTKRVPLLRPIPVYSLYFTAFVDPDGTIEFRDDLYGRDQRLADALKAKARTLVLAARGAGN